MAYRQLPSWASKSFSPVLHRLILFFPFFLFSFFKCFASQNWLMFLIFFRHATCAWSSLQVQLPPAIVLHRLILFFLLLLFFVIECFGHATCVTICFTTQLPHRCLPLPCHFLFLFFYRIFISFFVRWSVSERVLKGWLLFFSFLLQDSKIKAKRICLLKTHIL